MKKIIGILTVLIFFGTSISAQNGKANVVYKKKLIFLNAIPTESYKVVGKTKYKNTKKNERATIGDVTGISNVVIAIDDALEKVEKGKQESFQAVIVYSPIKIELINFETADPLIYQKCNVGSKGYKKKKCGDKTIYFMSLPMQEYEVVKTIDVKNFTNLGQLKMGKNIIDNFLNKLYERSCKEAKEGIIFDAIILDDPDIVNKRGFLTTKTILLVKLN